jgi:hypothetical protein
MPQLGLGLRANVSGVSFYDGDAAAYFTRAGVTDATAKAQINAFVKGVKDLGLWSSMVSWPLRSTQNAGTGTTAYSLGGLGTYNGTLTGGPTWETDGITFDGTNDYIVTGAVPITGSNPRSLFAVGKSSTGSLNILATLWALGSLTTETWGILQFPNTTTLTGWTTISDSTIGTITSGSFNSSVFGYSTSRFGFINGISQTLTGSTAAPNTKTDSLIHIGSQNGAQWFYNGQIPFIALFNSGASTTNIHSLYKTTLGQGLSLP